MCNVCYHCAVHTLCKTQAHAGEEQKKEESLELHICLLVHCTETDSFKDWQKSDNSTPPSFVEVEVIFLVRNPLRQNCCGKEYLTSLTPD